jgi:hypothetical protein
MCIKHYFFSSVGSLQTRAQRFYTRVTHKFLQHHLCEIKLLSTIEIISRTIKYESVALIFYCRVI